MNKAVANILYIYVAICIHFSWEDTKVWNFWVMEVVFNVINDCLAMFQSLCPILCCQKWRVYFICPESSPTFDVIRLLGFSFFCDLIVALICISFIINDVRVFSCAY